MTIEIPWVVVLAGRALAVLTAAGAVIGLLVGIVREVVRRGAVTWHSPSGENLAVENMAEATINALLETRWELTHAVSAG